MKLENMEVWIMKSKNWLWVVITCLAIVVVYQIVRLPEGKSPDSPSQEMERISSQNQRTSHVVSLAEMSGMPEENEQSVIDLSKIEKPQKPTTITENLVSSSEGQDTFELAETEDAANSVEQTGTTAKQDPPSLMSDGPAAGTIQAPLTTTSTAKSTNKGVVRGIIYSEEHGFTLIDETIVRTGAVIDGAKVVNIHAGGVEFEKEGRRWTQKVGEVSNSQ